MTAESIPWIGAIIAALLGKGGLVAWRRATGKDKKDSNEGDAKLMDAFTRGFTTVFTQLTGQVVELTARDNACQARLSALEGVVRELTIQVDDLRKVKESESRARQSVTELQERLDDCERRRVSQLDVPHQGF